MKLNYSSFIQVVILGSSSYELYENEKDTDEMLLKKY